MTISINTIAGNDVIDRSEWLSGVTISGLASSVPFPLDQSATFKIFNSTGTQVLSRDFVADGNWRQDVDFGSLGDGTYTVSVNLANDAVAEPTTRTVTVDLTPPTLTSITLSNTVLWPGDTALVTFKFSEPVTGFTTADISPGLALLSNFTQVDATTYTATLAPFSNTEGPSSVLVFTDWTDAAGNRPANAPNGFFESPSYDVDTKAPTPGIAVFSALDDTGSSDTPIITADNLFRVDSLFGFDLNHFTTTLQWSVNGGAFTTFGVSSFFLPDGDYRYRFLYTDPAGNTSVGDAIEVIIDTTAPAAGTLAFAGLTDTGRDDTPDITTDNAFGLTLSGQETGTTVTYQMSTDDGATWSSTTANLSGLADATYRFRAVVEDAAGNTSNSNELVVTIDHVAMAGTLAFVNLIDTGSDDAPDITSDNAFDLALGGQEASATAVYQVSTDGGTTWATTGTNQAGLADATYHYRALVTDGAGNSATSNTIEVTVDHRAPVPGTLAFANLASLGADGVTNDNTFDLALAGQESGAHVAYQVSTDGGVTWLTTTASQSDLPDEAYRFRAFVVDAAGNISSTNELAITVDHGATVNNPISTPTPKPPAADFDGDGHGDILWQNADGTPAVWLANGTSLISGASVGFNPGADWHEIGGGDFNGDGKSDILWQNRDGTIAEWFMDGTRLISGGSVGFNPGPAWHAIGTGDFNGDGKSDILWQNADGTPAVWLMDGLNILSGANVGFNPGAAWHAVDSGDFNGDGKADILWQNDSGQAAVWLMNGTNLLGGANVGSNPGPSWKVQAAGDFNGDGKADILWQNDNGQAAVWLMNGTSLISGANVGFNPGAAWQVHDAIDFNGDGKADILWQSRDGTPAVWLMDGTNVISGSNVGFNPGGAWHVTPQHHDLFV